MLGGEIGNEATSSIGILAIQWMLGEKLLVGGIQWTVVTRSSPVLMLLWFQEALEPILSDPLSNWSWQNT